MDFKYKITLEGNDGNTYTMKCIDFDIGENYEFITVQFSKSKVGTNRLGLYKSWVIEEL